MALTLGTTGMDSATAAQVRTAFEQANADSGRRWQFIEGDSAEYFIVDMDSLYGPMSWLRLHASARMVIGLTGLPHCQTDFRLSKPVSHTNLAALLRAIADGDAVPASDAAEPETDTPMAAAAATAQPAEASVAAAPSTVTIDVSAPAEPAPAAPVAPLTAERDRSLRGWLDNNALPRRVRLQRAGAPALLIDAQAGQWHGSATLKPLAAYFDGTLELGDFDTPDDATWEHEATALGTAQPLARLRWFAHLLAGHGALLPAYDSSAAYRLNKWPQTEREFPKHFRIATVMMKGPATIAEITAASAVSAEEVADFINANLATGYAQPASAAPEAVEEAPQKPSGGLFGRLRGR